MKIFLIIKGVGVKQATIEQLKEKRDNWKAYIKIYNSNLMGPSNRINTGNNNKN